MATSVSSVSTASVSSYTGTTASSSTTSSSDTSTQLEQLKAQKNTDEQKLTQLQKSTTGSNSMSIKTLEKEVAQNAQVIKASAGKEDPNTGLLWQEARMVGWMKKGELLNSIDPIWSMAKDSYQTSCSVCHKQPVVTHFDANTWPGLFGGMVGFTSMDKDTRTVVLKYLQNHSSDFAKGNH